MIKVNAVESNNQRRSCIYPMAEGALTGTALGYVLKGAYPVTLQEKSTPAYQHIMSEIDKKRYTFGPENLEWLNDIKSKGNLSLAEDTFVKMYDGIKEGDKLGHGFNQKLRENFLTLQKKDSASAQEFRRLMHQAKYEVEQTVKRSIDGYNSATKEIRPLSFFLIGGAVIGAIVGLIQDVLKTNVKNS